MRECPLCQFPRSRIFYTRKDRAGQREFFLCSVCDLVFVPAEFHLDAGAQRERYLEHNNDPDDPDYRKFLSRLSDELVRYIRPGAKGLDYGAGPGPALAKMMREQGFDMHIYDPYFHPDESALETRYDFITCTETAEHFSRPGEEFDRLQSMLEPSGWLGVMTGMLSTWDKFPDWYYHRDPTHISFYSRKTMQWIADHGPWRAVYPRNNVVLFQKLDSA